MSYGVHDNVGDVKSVVQVSETKRKGNARVMPDGRLITTMREMADAMTTEIYRQLVPVGGAVNGRPRIECAKSERLAIGVVQPGCEVSNSKPTHRNTGSSKDGL
jgi:hypothetical protein